MVWQRGAVNELGRQLAPVHLDLVPNRGRVHVAVLERHAQRADTLAGCIVREPEASREAACHWVRVEDDGAAQSVDNHGQLCVRQRRAR
jgi:hypothetical protein